MNVRTKGLRSFLARPFGTPRRGPTKRALGLLALSSILLPSMLAAADSADSGLDSVLEALAVRHHHHALYSERIESALFKQPLVTSGELYFDAPDRLEKKTLLQAPVDLLVEGDVVTIVRGVHRTTMRLSDNPQLSPLLDGIRATLAGDRAALERAFQLAFNVEGSGWALTLQPLPAESKPLYKRIQIHGVGGTVQSVSLERASGERTTMTLIEAGEP
jgi:hypothetical protein